MPRPTPTLWANEFTQLGRRIATTIEAMKTRNASRFRALVCTEYQWRMNSSRKTAATASRMTWMIMASSATAARGRTGC